MATLPADRTKLTKAQENQVPSAVASSQRNIDTLTEIYDTVDLLNQKVDNHANAVTLPHADGSVTTAKLANSAVTTPKIADLAVTAAKVANQSLTADKFVPGALTNETQNALRITALEAESATKATGFQTYYVNSSGSDDNDGKTVGTPFKTIQKAVDTAFRDTSKYGILINIADGTYNEDVDVNKIYGGHYINLVGNVDNPENVELGSLIFRNCNGTNVQVTGVTFTQDRTTTPYNYPYGLIALNSSLVEVTKCKWGPGCTRGIDAEFSTVYAIENDFGTDNVEYCISANKGSQVISRSNIGNGTVYGLLATVGGKMAKYDATQPTGTVRNENITLGGIIWGINGLNGIEESGSNANGSYVKFSDGTMICTHRMNATRNSASEMRLTWVFPVPFVSSPQATAIRTTTGTITPADDEIGSTRISFANHQIIVGFYRIKGMTDWGVSDSFAVTLTATGKWK